MKTKEPEERKKKKHAKLVHNPKREKINIRNYDDYEE